MKTKPEPFKLTDADGPHLNKLKKLSQNQYDLLLNSEVTPRMTYDELVFHFGVPVGTVKSRLYRAKQRIIKFRKWANEEAIKESNQIESAHTESQ